MEKVNIRALPGEDIGTIVMAELIERVSIYLVDNLNAAYFSKGINLLDMGENELITFSQSDVFSDPDINLLTEDNQLSRYMSNAAFKIDSEGIWLLAELSSKPVSKDILSHNPVVVSGNVDVELIEQEFQRYEGLFETIWGSSLAASEFQDKVELQISKKSVAELLQDTLSGEIKALKKFPIPRANFSETIEYSVNDIDCDKVRKKYSNNKCRQASCPRGRCDGGTSGCDRNCATNTPLGRMDNPFCLAAEKACRLAVAADKATCDLKEEGAQVTCKALAVADKAKCDSEYTLQKGIFDTKQESSVAECKLKKAAATSGFFSLGDFKGGASGDGEISLFAKDISVDGDLSKINITLSSEIDISLGSTVRIQPKQFGYMYVCLTAYRYDGNFDAVVSVPSQKLELLLDPIKNDDGSLTMKATYSEIDFTAKISPAPLEAILKDPTFLRNCPQFATVVVAAGSMYKTMNTLVRYKDPALETMFKGNYVGNESIQDMEFDIKAREVELAGIKKAKMLPDFSEKSLIFVVN